MNWKKGNFLVPFSVSHYDTLFNESEGLDTFFHSLLSFLVFNFAIFPLVWFRNRTHSCTDEIIDLILHQRL